MTLSAILPPEAVSFTSFLAMSTVHPFRPEQLSSDIRPSEADIQSVLLTSEQIQQRVAELGAQISRDYEGKDPVLVGVLVGSAVFTADLLRHITIPCFLDYVAISSY